MSNPQKRTSPQAVDPLLQAEQLIREEKFPEAIAVYEQMMEPARPMIGGFLHNLIPLYLKVRRPTAALRAAQAYVYFNPTSQDAWMDLAQMRERLSDWEGALSAIHTVLELNPLHEGAHQSRLFLLGTHARSEDVRRYHQEWASAFVDTERAFSQPLLVDRTKGRRLRIGYVSGDFRRHVMDRFLIPLLQQHSAARFELFAYDTVCRPDEVTQEMRRSLAQWRDWSGVSDDAAAEQVRSDRIDLLVDMSGITFGQRLKVFGRRPAPIQITWAGYLPTTGSRCFDWKLCDETSGPQQGYTEPLWKIPNAMGLTPLRDSPEVTALPASRNGYVTFGCVNSYAKVTRECIEAWVEILRQVPTARLVLVVAGCSEQETAVGVLRRFGPVQDRVLLTEWATGSRFPTVFKDLDIALNTFPYGGCVTSFDTLWQGTPIVTLTGDRPQGRYAAKFMKDLDLPYFIATDIPGYISRAVESAQDIHTLKGIRSSMRGRIRQQTWYGINPWITQVERAYIGMWERYCGS